MRFKKLEYILDGKLSVSLDSVTPCGTKITKSVVLQKIFISKALSQK